MHPCLDYIERRMEILRELAKQLKEDFEAFQDSEGASRPREERSRLVISLDMRTSLQIYWAQRLGFVSHATGEYQTRTKSIKRGSAYRYPADRLAKYAASWEEDQVQQIENEFEDIRYEVAVLSRVRVIIRKYITHAERKMAMHR